MTMSNATVSPENNEAELAGLEDDPQWGAVLDELDGELPTRVTAMEFDDEWTRPELRDD